MAGTVWVLTLILALVVLTDARGHGPHHRPRPHHRPPPPDNMNCHRDHGSPSMTPVPEVEHLCCSLNSVVVPCIVSRRVPCPPPNDWNNNGIDYDDSDEDEDELDGTDLAPWDDRQKRRKRALQMQVSWGWGNLCIEIERTNCTVLTCTPVCCDGWRRDEDGRCVVPDTDTSAIVCENGGSTINNECYCRDGFMGRFCEIPICEGNCGVGKCKVVNEKPECVCPKDFTGSNCQLSVCSESCVHGRCVADGAISRCLCDEGYNGTRCDIQMQKPGRCPAVADDSLFGLCQEMCAGDLDCPANQKCCSNGCGHGCVAPSAGFCYTYLGRAVPVGEDISNSPCENCTCISPGNFECRKRSCPKLNEERCDRVITRDGECCPVCEIDEDKLPRNYQPPTLECPGTVQPIFVSEDGNFAQVPELKAYDYNRNPIAVDYSEKTFRSCGCHDIAGNLHRVLAQTERDEFGNFTSCVFVVDVQDRHMPRFESCPADITVWAGELISWGDPEASDNVAIAKKHVKSPHEKNTEWEVGTYQVTIVAEDYEGNKDFCIFTVTVVETEMEYSKLPPELRRREGKRHHIDVAMIAAPIAGGLLLIAILVVLVCCLCRKRRARAASQQGHRQANTHMYDNGLYSIYGKPPPVYSSDRGSVKSSKSMKSTLSAPPPYDNVTTVCDNKQELEYHYKTLEGQNRDNENGAFDNPVYNTVDDSKMA